MQWKEVKKKQKSQPIQIRLATSNNLTGFVASTSLRSAVAKPVFFSAAEISVIRLGYERETARGGKCNFGS